VKESAGTTLLDLVRERLAGKRTLVLLDNCEHLLGASSALVDVLLGADDGVRIVVTSREGLGIEGEHLVALRSMAVPADHNADLRSVQESDAVRLFVDPLAIELAAARVKALSVEQIRARLDDRFRLLTGGRSAVPRQQTLLAAIQWSYEQLTEEEQRLLRQLSVFSGGWTLESATAVAGDGADEFHVLDLLTRLIDKSLVLVEQSGATEARYTMLETVRQYGLERLVEMGESDTSRERHLMFFMQLGEKCYDQKFTHESYWGERFTTEHDNIRAALSFAREQDVERFVTFVGALGYFWWGRSHIIEGRQYIDDALRLASPDPVRRSYARALRAQAMFAAYGGDTGHSRQLNERVLAMWRELDDFVEIGHTLATLGWSQFFSNEEEPAFATFQELYRVSTRHGDPVYVNQAKVALGQVLVALSRVDEARQMAREILEFSRKAGDKRAEHSGYHFLADCAIIEGDCRQGLELYRQSLELAEAIGDRLETCFEVEGVAMALAGLGDHEAAIRLSAAARAEYARHEVKFNIRFWSVLVARYMTPAREALGVRAAEVERRGSSLSFEEAVLEAKAAARSVPANAEGTPA
jgi:predicted ATPase